MADRMIPSTTAGKTWALSVHRNAHNGEVYGFAIEGTLGDNGRSFETEHPGSRTVRYILDSKRLTKQARARALYYLAEMMRHNNLTKEGVDATE